MTLLKDEIDSILAQATKKAKASNINELCYYIPDENGYRMHHFTLRKLRETDPSKLISLINEHILKAESLKKVKGKPRAPSKKLNLGSSDLYALLNLARQSNNTALVEKLQESLPFSVIKKQMLESIRNEKIDEGLWNSYVSFLRSRDAS